MDENTISVANEDVRADPRKLQFYPARADAPSLIDFVARCFERVGVGNDEARLTAEILVDADLYGTETHGVALLYTHYIQLIQSGEINPTPTITVEQGSPTTVSIDGDRGLGMLVSHRSMVECLRMGEEFGSGWATAYNSTHSAAGAYYVRMAAARNMIGFHWSTGGSTIAAPGGRGRLVGNNPFSFGAPAGHNAPFVLDMAPSNTIRPKIRLTGWRGEQMPKGWAVDEAGEAITDPAVFFESAGAILPLGSSVSHGSYKGFGLLLMSDVMTGALSGDGGSLVRHKGEHSHAFGVVRVNAFPTGGEFGGAMDAMINRLHEAPTISPTEHVRFPGERAYTSYLDRVENGIPFRNVVVDELNVMADELGVPIDDVWRAQ